MIGIAGGPEKCAWLTEELGFDAAIDYKSESVGKALRAAAPDGIDIYFDNVGGEILDAALARLRKTPGSRCAARSPDTTPPTRSPARPGTCRYWSTGRR